MTSSRRLRKVGFSVVVFSILAMLILQSLSSSSATVSASLSRVPQLQTVEAEGYCMLRPLTLEVRAAKSGVIVEGEVVSRHSYWDSRRHNIYTANLVKVYKVFKGSVSGDQVEIITEGGAVGYEKQVTTPSLELSNGDMGVFFCEPTRFIDPLKKISAPSYMAHGSVQGFIRYSLADGSASEPFRKYAGIETDVYNSITSITGVMPLEVAENSRLRTSYIKDEVDLSPNATPTITGFSPTPITAGTDEVLTITGTGFGATQGTGVVEFKDADDGGVSLVAPIADDYVSWSDTEIKVMVPAGGAGGLPGTAGTGTIKVTNSDPASVTSTGTLAIRYAYTNIGDDGADDSLELISQMPDHVNDNTTGGYTFTMDTGEFTTTTADDAFLRAMNSWTCATGMNWTTTTGAIDVIASDTINAVRFDDGAELPGGVLGRATSRYSGCGPGGSTYLTWSVSEIDIAFDDGTSWEFGTAAPSATEFDFETVALHELGHGHQMSHVIAPGAVMHFALSDGDSARVLSDADRDGGVFVMSRSVVANSCGSGPMIAATGVACTPTAAPASISGQVTLADGTPLAGVAIRMTGIQNRLTITDANGSYHFDNVDTEQFYTVTPSRVNYHFNPGNRSFSLLGNETNAVFTAIADAVVVGNAIDTPEYFVRQHYLDFLGREPDEAGFNFWSDQILSCGSDAGCIERRTINVSAAYFLSIEFQETGGLVDSLYRASFGRAPKYAEFMPDTAALAQNVVVGRGDWEGQLEINRRAFIQSFVNRTAFRTAYDGLTNDRYVDELIAHTGVSYSSGERDALVSGLTTGGLTRSTVLQRIAENERFISAKRNEAFVMMEYFGYLRRDPDQAGFDYWLKKLNDFGGNFERAEMVKAFITSSEYRARFAR